MATGVVIVVLFYFLLFNYVHALFFEAVARFLSLARVPVMKKWTLEGPVFVLGLPKEAKFSIVMAWQRSGFFSIIVFNFLFVFLAFPLRGLLWRKVAWLFFGSAVGLLWNFIRWSLLVVAAYQMGASAFNVIDFLTGPFLDFLWVVPVWSIGLSVLVSVEKRNRKVS